MRRAGREGWVLAVLLVVFVAAVAYRGGRDFDAQRNDRPSTYNVSPDGTRAFYELLRRQGVRVSRWERPYARLGKADGVLVVFEPLERDVSTEDQEALWAWVQGGGGLLLIVDAKWRAAAKDAIKLADVRVSEAPAARPSTVAPGSASRRTPLLRDITELRLDGTTRLTNLNRRNENAVLIRDDAGAAAIYWRYQGGGQVMVASRALAPTNRALDRADNAVFLVNAATDLAPPGRRTVLVDEYHHGFGSEDAGARSLWEALGKPVRAAFWCALALCGALVYSLNRRFGTARRLPAVTFRPSTDYITSMAGLFRRAGAPEIALETVYTAFLRDIRARIGAPDARPGELPGLCARRLGWDVAAVTAIVTVGEDVLGGGRIAEAEAASVARQVQELRDRAQLAVMGR